MRIHMTMLAVTACAALAGCGLSRSVISAFDAPLNVGAALQTSMNNFSLTADDANASVANAAALQQAAATCARLGLTNLTKNTSSANSEGRNYFTIDFQCQ
jgi:long-subunit fatty acid transport protein